MTGNFGDFFKHLTGYDPYPYQKRLAESPMLPKILKAPTGSGKTAAAILAWLWRRFFHPEESVRSATPRRLVYCLPMRVLVEQTYATAQDVLARLREHGIFETGSHHQDELTEVDAYQLLGGEIDEEWHLHPEKSAIIVGTQDLLLSRALNRGYALSRFRWPVPFGLLNNDALWVFDEVQLMGAGVPTSAQLQAFRDAFGSYGPTATLWMSATLQHDLLATVDHPAPGHEETLKLTDQERSSGELGKRLNAAKALCEARGLPAVNDSGYAAAVAGLVEENHQPGAKTLVVVNTVKRAQQIYRQLEKRLKGPQLTLLHSRFRPFERQAKIEELRAEIGPESEGQVIVATQVVEAGVDISARLLITELAPWSSMVQRFGRCNRYGEMDSARILWIDIDGKHAAPYAEEAIEGSRELLRVLEGQSAAPANLPDTNEAPPVHEVLRRKDLIDLFDTAPDLSGNDVDVSRFVRDVEDRDVRVAWRAETQDPDNEWPRLQRDELCVVPIAELRDHLLRSRRPAWTWDFLVRRWRRIRSDDLFPTLSIVLHVEDGGYDPDLGWDPSYRPKKIDPRVLAVSELIAKDEEEGAGSDHASFTPGGWRTLADHTDDVVAEIDAIVQRLPLNEVSADLKAAARWHDLGKAHPVFQETLLSGLDEAEKAERSRIIWAKAPSRWPSPRHSRPYFRHEFASILAFLSDADQGSDLPALSDLSLYLMGSHHGRVRLAARSFSAGDGAGERRDRSVLGVVDGDELPAVDLGGAARFSGGRLSVAISQIGEGESGPSWLSRCLRLRDTFGPFRLAFLEAVFRAADARGSRKGEVANYG